MNLHMYYILDENNNPVPVEMFEYMKWMSGNMDKRIVKQEMIGEVRVSTVFLGLDHRFSRDEPLPVLFETMIFGGENGEEYNEYQHPDLKIIGVNII